MEFIWLFFIGLVANVLGTLAGGGGLISLPAMLLMGIPLHSAIGANKVSNTVSSLSSFIVIYKYKEVTVKEALIVIRVGKWCVNRSSSSPKIKKGICKAFTANRHHRINHSNCCF